MISLNYSHIYENICVVIGRGVNCKIRVVYLIYKIKYSSSRHTVTPSGSKRNWNTERDDRCHFSYRKIHIIIFAWARFCREWRLPHMLGPHVNYLTRNHNEMSHLKPDHRKTIRSMKLIVWLTNLTSSDIYTILRRDLLW